MLHLTYLIKTINYRDGKWSVQKVGVSQGSHRSHSLIFFCKTVSKSWLLKLLCVSLELSSSYLELTTDTLTWSALFLFAEWLYQVNGWANDCQSNRKEYDSHQDPKFDDMSLFCSWFVIHMLHAMCWLSSKDPVKDGFRFLFFKNIFLGSQ